MAWLRWLVWPLLLLPALWWGWHQLHAPAPGRVLDNGAELSWGDCWFDKPWWRPIYCGYFRSAPEPAVTPQSFVLPVVYIPQFFWMRRGPPVQYIAGGPGGSAWLEPEEIDFWLDWVKQTGWRADLVIYDQRGVGRSQPSLACPELHRVRRELLPLPLPTEEAYRRAREATRACHTRLREEGHRLTRFTTMHNATDARDLMLAMGLEQWDLYAVSYGTRVALELMRSAPQRIRAAVLDSPYPPEVNAELSDAWLLERALELFGRICQLVNECDESPQQLRSQLAAAFERAERELIRLSVRDPASGRDIAVVYDHEDLAWLLFEALYQWDAIPRLPAAVKALADGQLNAHMRSLIQDSVDVLLDESISDPVATSVDCHDNGPVDLREVERELARYPRAGPIKRFDWQYNPCRYWESGEAPESFRQPVKATVPTLLLAGEFDPVTPVEWAEQAARHLGNASLFVFPAVGHGVLDSHVCAGHLARNFFADPANPRVPACVARL